MFVDTHAHLCHEAFDEDRDAVLAAALAGGMPFLVNVGCEPASSRASVELARKHPKVYATCGIHPHDAADHGAEAARALIAELADEPEVVALGEMGLDYYYDHSPREVQREVFAAQLDEARSRDLPVVVHVRDAEDDALALLGEGGFPRGIWHCFTGPLEAAEAAVAGGMYISFSGILTFPSAKALREVAAAVPAERLLVETDCPYLTPVPHRGRRNQPSYVRHTARALAELRGVEPREMAAQLEANARAAFSIPEAP